jgi:hypothetical protein
MSGSVVIHVMDVYVLRRGRNIYPLLVLTRVGRDISVLDRLLIASRRDPIVFLRNGRGSCPRHWN